MSASFPPDVLVLDDEKLLHARLARGKKGPRIVQAKSWRIAANTFSPAVVSPSLTNESSLADAVRRMRMETGRWDTASLLLPDSWFRINILDVGGFPEGAKESEDMVRWSLKRTMPLDPEQLRIRFQVLSRTADSAKVLALSAIDHTLTAIEKVFAAGGIDVVMIEPIGMNIWNAITVREDASARDRIFFYIREHEFLTAAFRGSQPLFIRSRNLNSDRTLEQEMKLSASYLRDTLRAESVEQCYVSGSGSDLTPVVSSLFSCPARRVTLDDVSDGWPDDAGDYESELAACAGVFTS